MTPGAGALPPDEGVDPAPAACYRHPDRLTYITCTRCGRPICPECMRPAAVGFHCPDEIKEAARSVRPTRTVLGGRSSMGQNATTVLIGLNVAVLLVMTASGTSLFGTKTSKLFNQFALIPDGHDRHVSFLGFAGVAHGDYYRLFTSMFLHFGIIHLFFNMYVLMLVGPPLEQALGRVRFVGLYLLAGLGGSVASYAFAVPYETAAGASGAIFGLFGAFYIVSRRLGRDTGAIVVTILFNLVLSVSISNIDIRAHLGGLVTGAAFGAVLAYAPRERRTQVQAVGALVVVALLVGGTALRTKQLHNHNSDVVPVFGYASTSVGVRPDVSTMPLVASRVVTREHMTR